MHVCILSYAYINSGYSYQAAWLTGLAHVCVCVVCVCAAPTPFPSLSTLSSALLLGKTHLTAHGACVCVCKNVGVIFRGGKIGDQARFQDVGI